MAAGVRAGTGGEALMTYHPSGGDDKRTSPDLHEEAWLDVNMMQSGHGAGHDVPVWRWVEADHALRPPKPCLDGEPNYEDHPVNPWPTWDPASGYFRAHDVRKQIYRSVLAGGCGVTYGHHAVWQFADAAVRAPVNHPDRPWRAAIVRPGAQQVVHLRRLLESRPFLTRVPDQSILASDPGQRGCHVRAARDAHGRYAMVYVPNTQTVDVRLDAVKGRTVDGWWFDPRRGSATRLGPFQASGVRSFTPPEDGPDWVLVLDDPAQAWPPPGSAAAR
jgi:hypothetical protein